MFLYNVIIADIPSGLNSSSFYTRHSETLQTVYLLIFLCIGYRNYFPLRIYNVGIRIVAVLAAVMVEYHIQYRVWHVAVRQRPDIKVSHYYTCQQH